MKKNTHPAYQEVLFIDTATGKRFVIGSTLQPKNKEIFEGKEYPVYHLAISSYSHPFFQKKGSQLIDTEGRVDRFTKRYAAVKQKQEIAMAAIKTAEEEKKKEKKRKK